MKNNFFGSIGLYVIILVFIIAGLLATKNMEFSSQSTSQEYTYTALMKQLNSDDVDNIKQLEIRLDSEISDAGEAIVYFNDGTPQKTVAIASISDFMSKVNEVIDNEDIEVKTVAPAKTSMLVSFIPTIVVIIISIILLMFIVQQMQGGGGGKMMNFGKSRARLANNDKNKVTFKEVAGLEEEKADLEEIVEFLKFPQKFVEIGARIPKGLLLVGPPGTGKTLLAKAVAGEAGVPFFSISGSDFVEMFVGVGASRVRDLFEQAKKNAPCLIFIDEIDAVGRKRGAGLGGGHDEREQTLNQLLVEMDGFGANEGVIVIAATNRPDILDPALLRPGRFDRRVVVNTPDVKGREEILKVHAKGKQISDDVDLSEVAKTTSGFTGADLENLLNEAALLAARLNKTKIDIDDLRKAFVKVGIGTEKKSRAISEKEKRITAYHEAGHAILFEELSELDPVHIISIIPTGMAGGYTMPLPSDKSYQSKLWMEQEIVSLFGGRAAEEIIIKDITTGASNDIERATKIARAMVTRYGMSEKLGPVQFGEDNDEIFLGKDFGHTKNYSEQTAMEIDNEIHSIVEKAYSQAMQILTDNIDILHDTAKLLMENEKITGDEFREIIKKYKEPVSLKKENIEDNNEDEQ